MHTLNEGEAMGFDEVYTHSMYKDFGSFEDFDIAILRFKAKIHTFSPKVLPICVPEISKMNQNK